MPLTAIDNSECLTRFVFDTGKFAKSPPKIKFKAFLPVFVKELNRFETSVFRKDFFESEGVCWETGKDMVGKGVAPKVRADFLSQDVRDLKLNVVPETSSHKLHAAIIDWPESKDTKMLVAKELAARATMISNPLITGEGFDAKRC